MRRIAIAVSCALVAAALIPVAAPSRALGAARPLECSSVTRGGRPFRICEGKVATLDGSGKLDADVTLPARGEGPFPLVVLMHGLGGSKTSYESNTIEGSGARHHLNNLWFASRGYVVLNFTSRGFDTDTLDSRQEIDGSECVDESVQSVDDNPDLYADDPACRPQLSHLDHEVSDVQQLISRLVDGTLLDADGVTVTRRKIGVVGVSYGGGPTWILTRRNVWRTSQGNRVKLAAAVPIITWTDLVYALLPNGRGRDDGEAETDVGAREAQPPGVFKQSFATALYLSMNESSSEHFELTDYLNAWYDRVHEGEPYNDQVAADAIHKLLTKRSAYYIPKRGAFQTPTLAVQGFTDFLFSAIEPLRMYQRLRGEHDGAPMSMYFGDWGHPLSQNRADETAYIAGLVNRWLDFYLMGNGDNPSGIVEARVQDCASDTMGQLYRAATWEGLQTADERMELAPSGQIGSPADDIHSADLDPAPGVTPRPRNGCAVTNTAVDTDNIAGQVELTEGFEMLGMPEVTLTADPSAPDMYVEARLWDVDPATDRQTLVDRGVYRLGSTQPQEITFQLNGNAYIFEAGHEMKLELTADGSPSFLQYKPSAGTIDISDVRFDVPEAKAAALVP
ncbi:MAG: CocE/NonD family hydrolase [Actinomycetota bacterium]